MHAHRNQLAHRIAPLLLAGAVLAAPGPGLADPSVPGFTVEEYAPVDLPMRLSFDAVGNLFVGSDVVYPDSGSITRVEPGGIPAAYGPPLRDPDAVIAHDPAGLVPATPGAVFAGGVWGVGLGYVRHIRTDQVGQALWGPNRSFENPQDFEYDGQGRLLFVDYYTDAVHASTGGDPATLVALPAQPSALAINSADDIYVWTVDGTVRSYDSAGTLLNSSFATGLFGGVDLEFGPGGVWGTDLYTIANGTLLRIDPSGVQSVMGTGFSVGANAITGLAFGPDGALYASDYPLNRILRISPGAVDSPIASSFPGSQLFQNTPNPFVSRTEIPFAMARRGYAEVHVIDVSGRVVRRLHAGELPAGRHAVSWNGDDLLGGKVSSGVYFYRMTIDGKPTEARKALLRR
ncbi:MAG: hypothetical protein DHS20C21_08360 [Gemmatimonadota bacterium]|nr:MAG: hypothetical protein DHS20C21_08360 [Gemmatimonadota bacterium]